MARIDPPPPIFQIMELRTNFNFTDGWIYLKPGGQGNVVSVATSTGQMIWGSNPSGCEIFCADHTCFKAHSASSTVGVG